MEPVNKANKKNERMNKTNSSKEPIRWIKPSLCHGDPNGFLKSFPLSGVMNLRFKLSSQGACLSNPDPLQPLVPRPTHAPADACPDDQRFTAALNKTPRNETGHKMAPPPADIAGAGWARQERERNRGGQNGEQKTEKQQKGHIAAFNTSSFQSFPLFHPFFFSCAFHFHTFYFPLQSFSSSLSPLRTKILIEETKEGNVGKRQVAVSEGWENHRSEIQSSLFIEHNNKRLQGEKMAFFYIWDGNTRKKEQSLLHLYVFICPSFFRKTSNSLREAVSTHSHPSSLTFVIFLFTLFQALLCTECSKCISTTLFL